MNNQSPPWWHDRNKVTFAVFLGIGAYFLWTEHEAHVIEFLPWALILACVGMHVFMHRGHAHNGSSEHNGENKP